MILISTETPPQSRVDSQGALPLPPSDQLRGANAFVYRAEPLGPSERGPWARALEGLASAGVRLTLVVDGDGPLECEHGACAVVEDISALDVEKKNRYLGESLRLTRPSFFIAPRVSSPRACPLARKYGILFVGILDHQLRSSDPAREAKRRLRVRGRPQFVVRSEALSAALSTINPHSLTWIRKTSQKPIKGLEVPVQLLRQWILALAARINRWHFLEVAGLGQVISSLPAVLGGMRLVVAVHGNDCHSLQDRGWKGDWLRWNLTWSRWTDSLLVCHQPWVREFLRDRFGRASVCVGQSGWDRSVREGHLLRGWSLQRMNYVLYVASPHTTAARVAQVQQTIPQSLRFVVVGSKLTENPNGTQVVEGWDCDATRQLFSHAWVTVIEDVSDRGFQVALDQLSSGQTILVPDTVRYGELGDSELLFGSLGQLEQRLHQWNQSPAQLRHCRLRSRQLVEARFSPKRHAQALVGFLTRMSGQMSLEEV